MNKNIILLSAFTLSFSFFIFEKDFSPSFAQERDSASSSNNYFSASNFDGKEDIFISNSSFSKFMVEHGETNQPLGFIGFCNDNPQFCVNYDKDFTVPVGYRRQLNYDLELHKKISLMNIEVNRMIEPMSDKENYNMEEYWSFPRYNKGDCEDYVLLKKYYLMHLGIPEQVLLITVVRDEVQDGHAVLTLVTGAGDLILDNRVNTINLWYNTPYDYIKRQSQQSPMLWKSLKSSS